MTIKVNQVLQYTTILVMKSKVWQVNTTVQKFRTACARFARWVWTLNMAEQGRKQSMVNSRRFVKLSFFLSRAVSKLFKSSDKLMAPMFGNSRSARAPDNRTVPGWLTWTNPYQCKSIKIGLIFLLSFFTWKNNRGFQFNKELLL